MFRKNREEDYEEYNQRQNARYDDDYISETEEYRDECTHSHEQTYDNYDMRESHREYREECSHDHEQTYEDFNSELRPYEKKGELENKFSKVLMPTEHIVWCGAPEANATAEEKGTGCSKGGSGLLIVIAVVMLPVLGILSIGLIVLGVYLLKECNVMNRSYAITNSRLLIYKGSNLKQIRLNTISNINVKKSQRDIGCVMFVIPYKRANKPDAIMSDGIFAVKSPDSVAAVLMQAVAGSRMNAANIRSGSVING